jgi:hypothetical protein
LEIGVYNGKRANEMIEASKIFNNKINYYGFDLFEKMNKKLLLKESSKHPSSKSEILKKLSKSNVNIKLFSGYTNKTLPMFIKKKIKVDFVFIDGGHSIRTIRHDWKNISKLMTKNTVVILDDYYENNEKIIKKFGCNKVVKEINKKYYKISKLPNVDRIKLKNLNIRMIKITKNQ